MQVAKALEPVTFVASQSKLNSAQATVLMCLFEICLGEYEKMLWKVLWKVRVTYDEMVLAQFLNFVIGLEGVN